MTKSEIEETVKKVVSDVLDKKNEELVQKIRIFVDMTLNKVIDAKLKSLSASSAGLSPEEKLEQQNSERELNSTLSEILRELNSLSESVNELLDKVDSVEVRLEEP